MNLKRGLKKKVTTPSPTKVEKARKLAYETAEREGVSIEQVYVVSGPFGMRAKVMGEEHS